MKQKGQHQCQPLHKLTKPNRTPRLMKQTNNTNYRTNAPPNRMTLGPWQTSQQTRKQFTEPLSQNTAPTKITRTYSRHFHPTSSALKRHPRHTRRTLAQLKTNRSTFPKSYLHKINAHKHS